MSNSGVSKKRALINTPHHESDAYKWWALGCVMIGTFMGVLDSTIVNVALPKLMATFSTSVDKIEWVLTAYLLIFAVVLPSSGWLADRFGYKTTYIIGLSLFTFGSLLCSLAWNENVLIAFRVVQGSGAGFIMTVGMAITTRAFPPEQRGVALGFWGIASASSVTLGPLVGGYLVDNFSWHAIFDINVPIGIFAIFAVSVILHEIKSEKKQKFDIVGFVSMTVFLTSLLLALATGNNKWNTGGWTSPYIRITFALSIVSFIIFIITEFHVENPLVDLRLMKFRNFALANLILFIFGVSFFGNTFLLPLFLENSLGYTALQTGIIFIPVGVILSIVSPISGRLSDKGHYKIVIITGILLLTLSMYLSSYFSFQSERGQVMLPLYFRGLAMGLLYIPISAVALLEISGPKMAQASGMINTIRQVGGSFGIAILGSLLTRREIFHSQTFSEAVDIHSPAFQKAVISAKHFVAHSVGGTPGEVLKRAEALIAQNIFGQAFIQGINDDFLVGAVLTLSILVPVFFLKVKKIKPNKQVVSIE